MSVLLVMFHFWLITLLLVTSCRQDAVASLKELVNHHCWGFLHNSIAVWAFKGAICIVV